MTTFFLLVFILLSDGQKTTTMKEFATIEECVEARNMNLFIGSMSSEVTDMVSGCVAVKLDQDAKGKRS